MQVSHDWHTSEGFSDVEPTVDQAHNRKHDVADRFFAFVHGNLGRAARLVLVFNAQALHLLVEVMSPRFRVFSIPLFGPVPD